MYPLYVQFDSKNTVFELRLIHCFISSPFQMPTTRKQTKTRKSRGIEMLSDLENLDIMLGENHLNRNERDESLNSNCARRPESTIEDEFENNDENRQLDSRDVGPSTNADYGRNSSGRNCSAEINKLSSELNSRLSRELNEMMSSVNTQIQRAISGSISSRILPQIQTALNSGSGRLTQDRWNIPAERPETNSELFCNEKSRGNSRNEPNSDRPNDGALNTCAYDTSKIFFENFSTSPKAPSINFFDILKKLDFQEAQRVHNYSFKNLLFLSLRYLLAPT